jgi:hypothetical protein
MRRPDGQSWPEPHLDPPRPDGGTTQTLKDAAPDDDHPALSLDRGEQVGAHRLVYVPEYEDDDGVLLRPGRRRTPEGDASALTIEEHREREALSQTVTPSPATRPRRPKATGATSNATVRSGRPWVPINTAAMVVVTGDEETPTGDLLPEDEISDRGFDPGHFDAIGEDVPRPWDVTADDIEAQANAEREWARQRQVARRIEDARQADWEDAHRDERPNTKAAIAEAEAERRREDLRRHLWNLKHDPAGANDERIARTEAQLAAEGEQPERRTCGNPNGCARKVKAQERCSACYEWRREKREERPLWKIRGGIRRTTSETL